MLNANIVAMNLKLKLARKLKVFSVLVARQHGRLIEIASLRDVLYVVVHIFMDKRISIKSWD